MFSYHNWFYIIDTKSEIRMITVVDEIPLDITIAIMIAHQVLKGVVEGGTETSICWTGHLVHLIVVEAVIGIDIIVHLVLGDAHRVLTAHVADLSVHVVHVGGRRVQLGDLTVLDTDLAVR